MKWAVNVKINSQQREPSFSLRYGHDQKVNRDIKELKVFRNGILLEEITSYNEKVPFHLQCKI